jgi:RHS repeat-associated protein
MPVKTQNIAINCPNPFGMLMPNKHFSSPDYRYGFNKGSENDDEITGVSGSHMTTFFREYDNRLGRTWSIDPVFQPWLSPYVSMDNNPIYYNDPLGDRVKFKKSDNGSKRDAKKAIKGALSKSDFKLIKDDKKNLFVFKIGDPLERDDLGNLTSSDPASVFQGPNSNIIENAKANISTSQRDGSGLQVHNINIRIPNIEVMNIVTDDLLTFKAVDRRSDNKFLSGTISIKNAGGNDELIKDDILRITARGKVLFEMVLPNSNGTIPTFSNEDDPIKFNFPKKSKIKVQIFNNQRRRGNPRASGAKITITSD